MRVPARKITASRAVVGHEQSVAWKDGVPDHVGKAGGRMAWHMQRHCLECAHLEPLTVAEKVVELAAIPGEIAAGIEYLPEHLLDAEDLVTDRHLPSQSFAQVRCRRQMVRVGMRLEQPSNTQTFRFYVINEHVNRPYRSPAGGGIEVQHAVDDRAGLGCRITHNVADCIRCLVEEGLDGRAQRSRSQRSLNDPTGVCAGRVAVFGGHNASMGTFRLNIHYFINNASMIEIVLLPLRSPDPPPPPDEEPRTTLLPFPPPVRSRCASGTPHRASPL